VQIIRTRNQVLLVQDIKLLEAFEGLVRVDKIKATLDQVTEHYNIDPDDLTRYKTI
jgi:hypothetical protein